MGNAESHESLPRLESERVTRFVLQDPKPPGIFSTFSLHPSSFSWQGVLSTTKGLARHKVYDQEGYKLLFKKQEWVEAPTIVPCWEVEFLTPQLGAAPQRREPHVLKRVWVVRAKKGQLENALNFSDEKLMLVDDATLRKYQRKLGTMRLASYDSNQLQALVFNSDHKSQAGEDEEIRVIIDVHRQDRRKQKTSTDYDVNCYG